jgi:hypothetical protein
MKSKGGATLAKEPTKQPGKSSGQIKKDVAAQKAGVIAAEAVKASGAGNIGQIRDILFGAQMKDYDRRFTRLEERLNKEAEDLRTDVKKRMDNLETYIKSEIESLGDRLKTEQEGRVKSDKDLSEELRSAGNSQEKALAKLEERMTKDAREVRQQLLDQSKELSDELSRRHEQSMSTIENSSSELRDDKVDRSILSNLFAEVALRLTNEQDLSTLMETVDLENE